jgi:hypothetical protein
MKRPPQNTEGGRTGMSSLLYCNFKRNNFADDGATSDFRAINDTALSTVRDRIEGNTLRGFKDLCLENG